MLVRLQDETGRIVPPGAFLPAAERYGLMHKIDTWVVEHTLRWLNAYRAYGYVDLCHLNISGASLANECFLPAVLSHLDATDIPGSTLCFEITETAAISNLASARCFIETLRARGCKFALDDFGSGLSSFGYLKSLPVDLVKIDGMFVKDMLDDPADLAMVQAIHNVARIIGKQTVAEFVETQEIFQKLSEIGIDYAQGYWLGRPEPLPTLPAAQPAAQTDTIPQSAKLAVNQ